ncbi:hypothetical protein ABZ485_12870 [Streptomyces albogriseolus]|uniref:hypothetical protein n=1 Tax=Streptomyces albogriseolus TaxID=1887 RepID=UPI003460AE4D
MLNYCTDESKASTRNLKTGVVEGPGTDPEVFCSVSMAENELGPPGATSPTARSRRPRT